MAVTLVNSGLPLSTELDAFSGGIMARKPAHPTSTPVTFKRPSNPLGSFRAPAAFWRRVDQWAEARGGLSRSQALLQLVTLALEIRLDRLAILKAQPQEEIPVSRVSRKPAPQDLPSSEEVKEDAKPGSKPSWVSSAADRAEKRRP